LAADIADGIADADDLCHRAAGEGRLLRSEVAIATLLVVIGGALQTTRSHSR
jgi:hypothetical protein